MGWASRVRELPLHQLQLAGPPSSQFHRQSTMIFLLLLILPRPHVLSRRLMQPNMSRCKMELLSHVAANLFLNRIERGMVLSVQNKTALTFRPIRSLTAPPLLSATEDKERCRISVRCQASEWLPLPSKERRARRTTWSLATIPQSDPIFCLWTQSVCMLSELFWALPIESWRDVVAAGALC